MKDKKTARFSIKVYVIVNDSKYNPHLVKLDDVEESLKRLNLHDDLEVLSLGLMIMKVDKRVYH